MVSTPKKRPSRRLSRTEDKKAVKAHVRLTGEVVWAWTALHRGLAMTFVKLFPNADSHFAMTIWNAVVADSTQRDMLSALVDEQIGLTKKEAKALGWVLKRATDLAKFRNDAVHAQIGFRITGSATETRIAYFGNPWGRVKRHSAYPSLPAFLRVLRGDLLQLSDYAVELSRIVGEPRSALPQKPRLQLLPPPKKRRSQEKSAKAQRPLIPPQASRE
jgi:hypothetical protein